MARYVHPDVKDFAQSAAGDTSVRVSLVLADSEGNAARERVEELAEGVHRELPSGVLLIEVAASSLPTLFELEGIESISPASGMEILV